MKQKQRLVDQFLQTKEKDKGKKMGPHQNQDLVDYKSSDDDPSFHKNLLRVQKDDVFKKYEVIEQFGLGSMGEVSKVRIRHHKVGGSAFDAKPKGLVGKFKKRIKIGSKGASSTSHSVESGKDYYYALKTIQLDRIKPTFIEELKNEINILRTLDHPNIVKAHEVFLWKKQQIFIVLELCDGGDLYTRSPYSEKEAAFVTSKLLSALVYMHDHKVIHRDLKVSSALPTPSSSETQPSLMIANAGSLPPKPATHSLKTSCLNPRRRTQKSR
jgi:serine/threonine protein kinase